MRTEQRTLHRDVLSRRKTETKVPLMALFEARNIAYFTEELCIPPAAFNSAFDELLTVGRQWAELCRLQPHKAEIYFKDLQETKRKILRKLLKKSLLYSDNPETSGPQDLQEKWVENDDYRK